MSAKILILRFAGLALFTFLGFVLMAMVFLSMVILGLTPQGDAGAGFGRDIIQKSMLLGVMSALVGAASIFIKDNWRWVLYLTPLYAPSLFAVIYTLHH